jgi:hypothetical protein
MAGAWTYAREGETLKIHHLEHDGVAELVIERLGETSRQEFSSLDAVLLYLTNLEHNLGAQGWRFVNFVPERRHDQDRRRTARSDSDRRRSTPLQHPPAGRLPEE